MRFCNERFICERVQLRVEAWMQQFREWRCNRKVPCSQQCRRASAVFLYDRSPAASSANPTSTSVPDLRAALSCRGYGRGGRGQGRRQQWRCYWPVVTGRRPDFLLGSVSGCINEKRPSFICGSSLQLNEIGAVRAFQTLKYENSETPKGAEVSRSLENR